LEAAQAANHGQRVRRDIRHPHDLRRVLRVRQRTNYGDEIADVEDRPVYDVQRRNVRRLIGAHRHLAEYREVIVFDPLDACRDRRLTTISGVRSQRQERSDVGIQEDIFFPDEVTTLNVLSYGLVERPSDRDGGVGKEQRHQSEQKQVYQAILQVFRR